MIQHNCSSDIVHSMKFTTNLPGTNVKQYHTDDQVRTVDDSVEGELTITSYLRHPKNDDTVDLLQNDDGFLFDGEEPEPWTYKYDICLTGDADLDGERCARQEAPVDPEPEDPTPVTNVIEEPQSSCEGVTAEAIAARTLLEGATADDYVFSCRDVDSIADFVNVQADVQIDGISAYSSSGADIQRLVLSLSNGNGASEATDLGLAVADDDTLNVSHAIEVPQDFFSRSAVEEGTQSLAGLNIFDFGPF